MKTNIMNVYAYFYKEIMAQMLNIPRGKKWRQSGVNLPDMVVLYNFITYFLFVCLFALKSLLKPKFIDYYSFFLNYRKYFVYHFILLS